MDSAFQDQPQRPGDFGAEYTERCSGVDTRRQADLLCPGSKDNRHYNAFILARIVVNMRERKLMHALPAAERYATLPWDTCEEGLFDAGG